MNTWKLTQYVLTVDKTTAPIVVQDGVKIKMPVAKAQRTSNNNTYQHKALKTSFRNKQKTKVFWWKNLSIEYKKKNKKTCCSRDAANLQHVFTICNSEVMVNAAVLLIISTHPADSNVSEIKFQFKVKFTHYAEIMQAQGKQCVICNSAYKTQLGILKERTKLKKLSLSKHFSFILYQFTYEKLFKKKTTYLNLL